MTESPTFITLAEEDCALILRSDGSAEAQIPETSDEDVVSPQTLLIAALMAVSSHADKSQEVIDWFLSTYQPENS